MAILPELPIFRSDRHDRPYARRICGIFGLWNNVSSLLPCTKVVDPWIVMLIYVIVPVLQLSQVHHF